MLRDKVRTLTYRLALVRAKRRLTGGVLLDVGCGTGILSMFGAKAGASRVYALDGAANLCKLAREIIAENGLSSRITVVNGRAEDVQLDVDCVDAIVSEWMGHALLFENMLPSVLHTRDRFLNPPPSANITDLSAWRRERLFPCRTTLYIAGFSETPSEGYDPEESRYSIDEEGLWDEISELYEVNLTGAFASAARNDSETQIYVDLMDPKCIITRDSEIATLDLATVSPNELTEHGVKGSFALESMGTADLRGFVIWFTVEFPDGDILSTSPYKKPTHWQQSLLYLSETLSLVQDDVLSGEIHFTHPTEAPRDLAINIDFVMNNSEETRVKRTYRLSS
ncbi:unnamed protein product [Hymenolepis diminuta]|uniref:Protein arginine N-methyltransferase 6 n=1 Tax=Hymenolepis diminuta TaxID=6216 RepID=A0A564YKV5_HYMDI|nr:unnamed protein product [Hymenolepis diminuta]